MFYVNLIKNNHNLIGLDGVFCCSFAFSFGKIPIRSSGFFTLYFANSESILCYENIYLMPLENGTCNLSEKLSGNKTFHSGFVHETHLNFIKLQWHPFDNGFFVTATITHDIVPTVWHCFIFKSFCIPIQQYSCIWIMNFVNRRQRQRWWRLQ